MGYRRDDFRYATYGQEYNYIAEASHGLVIFSAIRALLKEHCVIFDETNSSEWSLKRIFRINHDAQYLTLLTSKEECLKRNREIKQISEIVFHRIQNQLNTVDPEQIREIKNG